jgi:cytochrome P450
MLRFFGDPIGRMQALRREYGDLAAVADRNPALICAFGAEHNREVLSKGAVFQNDSQLPIPAPDGSALAKFNTSVIFANGETHRKYRRLLMPAFSKASLEGYAPDMIATAEASLQKWPIGETVDLVPLLRELTTNIVLRCIFGVDPQRDEAQVSALESKMLAAITSPWSMLLPLRIPGTPYNSLLRSAEQMRGYLLELIARKREQAAGQRDALSLMIEAHDEDGSQLTDDELLGNVHTLYVAGHDTSAHTLAWTLLLLERHPDILADLLDELDAELGGAPPRLDQLERLVVLDRVIKESMRLIPATPMLFTRVLAEDAPLGKITLPAQASVVLSPYVTHRDPVIYDRPQRFMPSRWARIQPSSYQYLPFGAGPRTCLGMGFASQVLRLVLPMIVQRHDFRLAPGAQIDRKVRGIVTAPKYGLPMLISKQQRQFEWGGPIAGDIHEMVEFGSSRATGRMPAVR